VLLAICALGFVYLFNPSTSTLYPMCPLYWFTGCYWPGCGSMQALHQLPHGHLVMALGLKPLMVLSLPFVEYFFASRAMIAVAGRPVKTFFVRPVFIWMFLVVVFAYWFLSNLPFYPFSLLAP